MMIKMRRSMPVVAFIALLGVLASGAGQARQAEDPGVLLRAAIEKEEVDGDLQAAIDQYKLIAAKFAGNRPVAAKALVRLGGCYEKLGLREAASAYQKVLSDYPDQADAVTIARDKLAVLQGARGLAEAGGGEFRIRKIGPLDVTGGPSPDGRLISCVDWDTGDLAVYEVASGKKRRITAKGSWAASGDFAEESCISPDGRTIAYNWYRIKDNRYDLRTVNVDGSGEKALYGGEDIDFIWPCGWTPDGRHILTIVTNKEKLSRIVLVPSTGGAARTVKEFKSGAPGKLSLSFDGRWIAYDYPHEVPWKTSSAKRDIYLLALDGSRDAPLAAHPADDGVLGWTPDGRSILFSSDRSGTWAAYAQAVQNGHADGDPQFARRDFGDPKIVPMGFTRAGSFYYGIRIWLDDIYIVSLDPATGGPSARAEKAALRFEGSNSCPCWSPDGDHLAYTSVRRQGQSEPAVLCIKSMTSGEEREVHPAIKDFDTVAWFPDGKSILVRGWTEDQRRALLRMDIATGKAAVVLILDDAGGLYGPALSRDGSMVFYDLSNWGSEIFRIMGLSVETKQKTELVRSSSQMIHYGPSPDGKWLAFGDREEGVACLRVIPTGGGEIKTLVKLDPGDGLNGVVWSPDGRHIYFSRGKGKSEASSLWRIPFQGGPAEKFNMTANGLGKMSFRPDGGKLAFNSWRFEQEVWVMENFLPAAREKK